LAGKSNRITWTVAALGALALMAAPGSASAKSLGTWKVVGGHLDQTVGWTSVSQSDDGCYTTTWRDHGTTDASFAAVKGQKLTLQNRDGYSFVKGGGGVTYDAELDADSQYNVKPTRDHPGDQCGPPTAKPPETNGCGTATHKFGVGLSVIGDRVEPWGAIAKEAWFGYACPSDDALSSIALAAPSTGSIRQFKRKNAVELSGHETSDSPEYVEGPGFDQVNNSQHADIQWSLRFKRVR
jgi:hypothetical protein